MIKKLPLLIATIGMTFAATPIFAFRGSINNINKDVRAHEEMATDYNVPHQDGPMFYPASYSTDITDEPYYSTQKSYTFDSMNYSNTPNYYRGDSVKVAVIDSGLNYTHEDFSIGGNQIIQGHSRTIDNTSGSWLYYQFSSGYQSKIVDSLGHGTNVASVIASQINALGCAGIAPNVELYIYKVTNTSNGYEWTAINSALSYCVSEGIDVINMSFQAYEHAVTYNGSTMSASTGCSSVMTSYINSCYNAGITLVAAAGNYNTSEPSYPASNNHVISVGSLAESSTTTKAGYSNTYGIDLVAPGTVYVADKGTNTAYKKTQGTSFSAPIVTAAIALYKQKYPSATPAQIESALYASCDPISGNPAWAGNGRLNIDKFLGTEAKDDYPTDIVINNIDGDTLELEVGDTFDVDYTVNGVGSYSTDVEFELMEDNGTISINSSGHITALAEGEEIVTISSIEDSSVNAVFMVNVSPSSGGGGETSNVTINFASGGNCTSTSGSFTGVSFTTAKNSASNSPFYSDSGHDLRLYYANNGSGNSLTLTPSEGYSIIEVVITATSTSYTPTVKYNIDGGSDTQGSWSSNKLTVSDISASSSFVFRNANTTSTQLRLSSIAITLETAGPLPPTLSSITLNTSNVKTSFNINETFTYSGLVVTAHYSDSSSEVVSSGYTVSTPDMTFAGNKTVTVTYNTKEVQYSITVNSAPISGITATVSKTFYVGETITTSDITVKDSNNDTVSGFTFANNNYQFKYTDAASGGSSTAKTFTNSISWSTYTCSLTVQVQRKARVTPEASQQDLSISYSDLPTSYQTSTTERTAASGVKFIAYNCAHYSNNGKMQFKASGGYVRNTESLELVSITLNNRETNPLTVYGGNSSSSIGTSISGSNDVYNLSGYSYFKVIKNGSGAAYCTSITIRVNVPGSETATNVSNYIMYEDTANQCTSKFSIAKGYFESMSSAERSTFMTSNDYVISAARERLQAWAAHLGKTITTSNGDYVISQSNRISVLPIDSDNLITIFVVILTSLLASSVGAYVIIKRRKTIDE